MVSRNTLIANQLAGLPQAGNRSSLGNIVGGISQGLQGLTGIQGAFEDADEAERIRQAKLETTADQTAFDRKQKELDRQQGLDVASIKATGVAQTGRGGQIDRTGLVTPTRSKAFDKDIGKEEAAEFALFESQKANLPKLQDTVAQLKGLAPTATFTGLGRAKNFLAKELGRETPQGAIDRTKFQAIINNNVLPLLKETFGAAFTVAEGESLKASMGDVNATPEEKIATLEAFIENKVASLEAQGRKLESFGTIPAQSTGGIQQVGRFQVEEVR